MIIGRSGSNRTLKTPSDQGLSRRADKQLNWAADSHSAKFENALAVDGSVAFIWNKSKGSIVCTCRGFQNRVGGAQDELVGGTTSATTDIVNVINESGGGIGHSTVSSPTEVNSDGFTYVGESITADNLDDFFSGRTVEESATDKIKQDSSLVDRLNKGTGDYPGSGDIIDALSDGYGDVTTLDEDGDPLFNAVSLNHGNPTQLLTPTMVLCPICFGYGTVDSWSIYNGQRVILDASGQFKTTMTDVEIDDSQPVKLLIQPGSNVTWSAVGIPQVWRHLIKLSVYDMGKLLAPSDYKLSFIHPSAPTVSTTLDYETLKQLNSSALLATGNTLTITLEPVDTKPLEFTHIEFLFSLGDVVKLQMPEIDVPNQDEFADWNLNATFEMSSRVTIKENSYITEGKYKRVWKVETVNRKLTSAGKSYGYSVSGRALHSFEKAFGLMSVFGKPSDPFSDKIDEQIDDEL